MKKNTTAGQSLQLDSTLQQQQSLQLSKGCKALGLDLTTQQQDLLLRYLELLNKWNKAFNLTAVRNPAEHVSRHILDSLALLPHLQPASPTALAMSLQFLDVGTGAGLPGIPLAIAMPDSQWFLLDSNGKKTRFLNQCKIALPLANITIINERIENFVPPQGHCFTGITSRAYASLTAFTTSTEHLFPDTTGSEEGPLLYAMKGAFPKNEVSELPNNYKIQRKVKLSVPGCDGERHLLVLSRKPVAVWLSMST